jgi:membrane-bound inhibitor of C-type lysozyme
VPFAGPEIGVLYPFLPFPLRFQGVSWKQVLTMTHNLVFSFSRAMVRQAQASAILAAAALGFLMCAATASANDLVIHLPDNPSVSRQTIEYRCDAKGSEIGVPSGPFSVEYITSGGNSLVVVPISGTGLIFSIVISGSGVRYTAQQYTWWDA